MRSAFAAVVLLSCSGCGEMQEAEPVAKTVPVGLLILSATLGLVVVATVKAMRRADRSTSPLRAPRLAAALVLAPTALTGVAATGFLTAVGAFGYREAHVDVFSWADMVGFAAIVGGITAVTHALLSVVAVGITSASRRARNSARAALWVLVVGFGAASGAGLVWLPALAAAHWTAGPLPGTGVSAGRPGPARSAPRPRAGTAPGRS
jgi:hypothetical protein